MLGTRFAKRHHLEPHPKDKRGPCGDGTLTICHAGKTTLVLGRRFAKRHHLEPHPKDKRGACPGGL